MIRPSAGFPAPGVDVETAVTELGTGEALVSFLEGNGVPSMVERTTIRPPAARLGLITTDERKAVISNSPVKGKYDTAVDSESAYEILKKRVEDTAKAQAQAEQGGGGLIGGLGGMLGSIFGTSGKPGERLSTGQLIARSVTRTVVSQTAGKIAANVGKSVGGSMGGSIGRAIVRGALGGMLRRR